MHVGRIAVDDGLGVVKSANNLHRGTAEDLPPLDPLHEPRQPVDSSAVCVDVLGNSLPSPLGPVAPRSPLPAEALAEPHEVRHRPIHGADPRRLPCGQLKLGFAIRHQVNLAPEIVRLVPQYAEQVDDTAIQVVVDFDFARRLIQQHGRAAAEGLNVGLACR